MNKITKEEALELLKKVMGPPTRELIGDEHAHTWLVLQFLEPVYVSNNQSSITEIYHQAGKVYHVHYFTMAEEPMIEEVEQLPGESINII